MVSSADHFFRLELTSIASVTLEAPIVVTPAVVIVTSPEGVFNASPPYDCPIGIFPLPANVSSLSSEPPLIVAATESTYSVKAIVPVLPSGTKIVSVPETNLIPSTSICILL